MGDYTVDVLPRTEKNQATSLKRIDCRAKPDGKKEC
jgi:hypothetical protein